MEKLLRKAQDFFSGNISRQVSLIVLSLCFIAGSVFLTQRQARWRRFEYQRHDEIAVAFAESNDIREFPQANPTGSRITFMQRTEDGRAVILCDTATGKKEVVYEQNESKYHTINLRIWPWSPDGRLFAFSEPEELVVWQPDTAKAEIRFYPMADSKESRQVITDLEWLNPGSFVYVTEDGTLQLARKSSHGSWERTQPMRTKMRLGRTQVSRQELTALSENTLAWVDANCIWTLNLESNTVTPLFRPGSGELASFSYSKKNKQFLLNYSDEYESSVYSLTLDEFLRESASMLDARFGLKQARWITSEGKSWAGLRSMSPENGRFFISLHDTRFAEPLSLFTHGNVTAFSAALSGGKLFITGALSNDLATGIWQYDLASQTYRALAPDVQRLPPRCKQVQRRHGAIYRSTGRLDYYVYAPPHLDRHSTVKHPLIIAHTRANQLNYEGSVFEAIANCGGYVVVVNRPRWFLGLDQWSSDVMEIYTRFTQDQAIDRKRVFLEATSAETTSLSDLVNKSPDLWAGVILLSPVDLPDLSTLAAATRVPRILICIGLGDTVAETYSGYKERGLKLRVPVDVVGQSNAWHSADSKSFVRSRTRAVVHFIFDR